MSSEPPTHDLAIGRRLVDGTASADDVAAFAQWPLARRAPWLGAVFARRADPDPALRAAVVSALRGVRGVPGVRAIVAALGDDATRFEAVHALMHTARDAPWRYVHALFHGDPEVRRAAIPHTPNAALEMLAYLRADPLCADLVRDARWNSHPLPLAFDLHGRGRIGDGELVRVIASQSPLELRAFFETEHGRTAAEVEAFLDAGEHLRGTDVIDQAVAAIAGARIDDADRIREPDHPARWAARALETVMETVITKKPGPLTRRAAASLVALTAKRASAVLVGACCALEPRVLARAGFQAAHAEAAAAGLMRFKWPVKLPKLQVTRLLALPHVYEDLALATAVAGLYNGSRLKLLVKALGEVALLQKLLASDHGWSEICRLPVDSTALELAWLARIESQRLDRYIALASITLLAVHGKRLEQFIDTVPRRHRQAVFLATIARDVAADDPRIAAVCRTLASRLDRTQLTAIFTALLGDATERGPQLAMVLARAVDAKQLGAVGRVLADDAAVRFVALLDGPDPLPRDRELAIAAAFAERDHPIIGAWGRKIGALPIHELRANLPVVRALRALDDREKQKIATCPESGLEVALEPALKSSVTGLCEAISKRATTQNAAICAALLGCADPMNDVARELERFAGPTREFENELDGLVGEIFHRVEGDASPFLHARMFRWEAHDYALARWLETLPALVHALELAEALPGRFAARTLWTGIAEVVVFLRYRDPQRFRALADEQLALYCAHRVDRDIGVSAGRILVALVEAKVVPASLVKTIVLDRAADADALTREFLVRIARLDGMPEPPKVERAAPAPELLEEVRRCTDPVKLLGYCEHARRTVVQEAALQLLLLGEPGQLLLAGLLPRLATLAAPVPILASIELWDSEPALASARALAAGTALAPEWQFHLCMSLIKRGDDLLDRALAAARMPSDSWFRRGDWEKLVDLADEQRCAIALADSPHHHAYQPSVRALLESWDVLPHISDALVRFLEADANRPLMLRRDVARRLIKEYENFRGLPILVEEICDDKTDEGIKFLAVIDDVPTLARIAHALVDAALIGGDGACGERRMWHVLHDQLHHRLPIEIVAPLFARILEDASTGYARRASAPFVVTEIDANARLRDVADVFAWGIRRGIELTGKLFRVHMTSDEKDFGHTFLDQTKLYVSPLAMLRGEMHGRDIVEGLVLHELGHHIYHGGAASGGNQAQAIWKTAHDQGLGRLLNLVADEHLERNLRGVDPSYGDRLKRLGAYAFQHAAQELEVPFLLTYLRGSAADALIATPLEVAYDEASVKVRRGTMLAELDRVGHPLARFARAFRLGLGNRHQDPRVAAALELCGKDLRKLDMAGLWALTQNLAALFGGAVGVSRVFGGPEDLGGGGERDRDVLGAGIDDDILQREVERILDPKRGKSSGPAGKLDRLQLNVNPDEHFEKIHAIERVRGNADMHNRIATTIARHSARLRSHLDELGLRWERTNARIQGHTLDRARLRALVTRNDPRILIARTPVRRTDLFLGTLIDCSSSMTAGDNIERARRFGVLITEAVRALPGVEARFFGFTDSVIYDAGDARDCGVTGLRAEGGNNDAAGLFHAAQVAMTSRKRAKVLVMISDGLPTSCSVAALRGLVTTLSRRKGIVCAQVAVRELEEACFPHYVVLDDEQLDVAVARFGRMIADLTRRALGAS